MIHTLASNVTALMLEAIGQQKQNKKQTQTFNSCPKKKVLEISS